MRMHKRSALPDFYYAIFAWYEPFICLVGFVGAVFDPKTVSSSSLQPYVILQIEPIQAHDQQAPWPSGAPPEGPLPLATRVTLLQLAHVCALMGIVNFFVLGAARKHLHSQLALQEKIVGALLTPLVVGDMAHLYVTFWALGEHKWDVWRWSGMLWTTLILGLSLMVPRITWHIGIGRYVDKRDAIAEKK